MKVITGSKKFALWLAVTALISTLLLAGCAQKDKASPKTTFPEEYRGMARVEMVTGQEAINGISRLHGTDIPISQGYQIMYRGADKELTLWISESPTDKDAEKLLEAMNAKMSSSEAFTNYKEETVEGQKMYYVFGMNMDNYYYRKGNRVYWVALSSKDAKNDLNYILKDF